MSMRNFSPLVVLPLLLAPLLAQAQPTPVYRVTALGTLGGTTSHAYGINDKGQIVGDSEIANGRGQTHAFLYSEGVMRDLSTDAAVNSRANDINNAGQVVGYEMNSDGTLPHAFFYADGVTTTLPTLGGRFNSAEKINAAGHVVGSSLTQGNASSHAFLYAHGRMTDLDTLPGGRYSHAAGINNAGQIVGTSVAGDVESAVVTAFLYKNDGMHALGTLGGATSQAIDINNAGQVVGFSTLAGGGDARSFIYWRGVMTDITAEGDYSSIPYAINDWGQVVGEGHNNADYNISYGYLYTSGRTIDLNTLIDPASGWTITRAVGINNRGQIAAWGYTNNSSQIQALRLDLVWMHPSPNPE